MALRRHGHTVVDGHTRHSPTYVAWCGLKRRCSCTKASHYECYGGRGITFDPRWNDFTEFLKDMGERPEGKYSLDRIDNNGRYEKANCRWTTHQEQCLNRRSNVRVEHDGKSLTIREWATKLSIPYSRLYMRFYNGWSADRALT